MELNEQAHQTMISMRVNSSGGIELMKTVLQRFKEVGTVKAVSSLYKVWAIVQSPQTVHDIRRIEKYEGLAVVFILETTIEPNLLLSKIIEIEGVFRSERIQKKLSLNLVIYDDFSFMTPALTLPHPIMHQKPEILLLSAELWPDYIHPVLKQSLAKLTRNFQGQNWGQFHAQGKVLLEN